MCILEESMHIFIRELEKTNNEFNKIDIFSSYYGFLNFLVIITLIFTFIMKSIMVFRVKRSRKL